MTLVFVPITRSMMNVKPVNKITEPIMPFSGGIPGRNCAAANPPTHAIIAGHRTAWNVVSFSGA